MSDEEKNKVEEQEGTSTEVIIGFAIVIVIVVVFFVFFVGTGSKDIGAKIQDMEYNLSEVVQYGEGQVNQKSTQWDYSLPPNAFFQKYMAEYLNYSRTIERNLDDEGAAAAFFVYFVDDSYMQLIKNDCMEFHYDANGSDKPNQEGVDQHIFYLCPQAHAEKNNFINNPNF